ncbi:hypothetical protein GCM10020295_61710 [Streptomyces cinereospinus]
MRRELPQRLGERDGVRLLRDQRQQRGAVVVDVEAALPDLAVRDDRQALVGQVGEAVVRRHRAEQQLHGVVVVAGGAAAQQGEGAGVVEQAEQVHGAGSFPGGLWRGTAPENTEGRPSGGLREVLRTRSQWAAGEAVHHQFWVECANMPRTLPHVRGAGPVSAGRIRRLIFWAREGGRHITPYC